MGTYREVMVEDAAAGFAAWLVVEPSPRDMSFGGTRIDPAVTRDMVAELAENMTLKLAAHGAPVGGAKAGVRAAPDDPRLTPFLHRFAEECREALTTNTILGKDMGAKQWMLDEIYAQLKMPQLGVARRLRPTNCCPESLFQLDGYIENMTGQGVFWAIEQVLGQALRGARVLIQGFGAVGAGVAVHLQRAGARIVGVSDRQKSVLDPDGIDLEKLLAARDGNGLLVREKLPATCAFRERDDLLSQPADLLVLAAGSYLVDGDLAGMIQSPVVVEGANLALRDAARTVLQAAAVRVVPDVVANSASAALCGHQIASGNTHPPRALWGEIEAAIKRSTEAVETLSRQLDVDSKGAFRHLMATGTFFDAGPRRG